MSRIDQALHRAQGPASAVSERNDPDVFVSPWSVDGRAEAQPAAPRPVDEPSPHGVRGAVRGPELARTPDIHRFHAEWRERLTIWRNADPWIVEQYRALVATLIERQADRRLKTLMVTSPQPDDGKTLTSLNLALVLSELYRHSVLLIDADMRRPSIGRIAGLAADTGLNEAILPGDEATVSPVALTDGLAVLPAKADPDPVSGLSSVRMQQLLDEAVVRFDWVIVDSPPAGVVADAGLLSAMMDATILVIRAEETPLAAVQHTIDAIGRERILGVVLNAVREPDGAARGYYYPARNGRPSYASADGRRTAV